MVTFPDMLEELESFGMVDVVLPFLLIFTISFAVLQKSNILGDNKRPYNKIIAFVLAMSVVIPHVLGYYPDGKDVVEIINKALPEVSLVMVAGMMILLIIGVFGKDVSFIGTDAAGLVVIVSTVVVIYIFVSATGAIGIPSWLGFLKNPETQSLIVTLLVCGIIIWFITREPKNEDEEREPIRDTVNKMFGGVLGKNGH